MRGEVSLKYSRAVEKTINVGTDQVAATGDTRLACPPTRKPTRRASEPKIRLGRHIVGFDPVDASSLEEPDQDLPLPETERIERYHRSGIPDAGYPVGDGEQIG